jgi:MoxR-like ATPase
VIDRSSIMAALRTEDVQSTQEVHASCDAARSHVQEIATAVGSVIVGQEDVVEEVLIALVAGGHVLLEGVPGLGKTLLVRTLGSTLGLTCGRIQFTPDIMPSDITGTTVVVESTSGGGGRMRTFIPGPVFCHVLLADEINRATPRSQAALLEAMQEQTVTVDGKTHDLDSPFIVLATQNPIEQEGTYPLPEAQLDRFLLKVMMPFVDRDEFNAVLARTTTAATQQADIVSSGELILLLGRLARRIPMAPAVQSYLVDLVLATHPESGRLDPTLRRYIRLGSSPRGAQAMATTGRVRAILRGGYAVSFEDIGRMARPVLRHRILRSFEAETDGVGVDEIITALLEQVPLEYSPRREADHG